MPTSNSSQPSEQQLEQDLVVIEKASQEIASLIKQGVKEFTVDRLAKRQQLIEQFFLDHSQQITASHQQRLEEIVKIDQELSKVLGKEQHTFNKNQASRNRLKIYNHSNGNPNIF